MPEEGAEFRPAGKNETPDGFRVVPLFEGYPIRYDRKDRELTAEVFYADDEEVAAERWHKRYGLGVYSAILRVEPVVEVT